MPITILIAIHLAVHFQVALFRASKIMLQVVNCALNIIYQQGAMMVVIAEIRAVTSAPTWKATDR